MGELKPEQRTLVEALAEALRTRDLRVVSAESCTGGLIAAACTSVAGSSRWFERGFVTYSNDAKTELLGVPTACNVRESDSGFNVTDAERAEAAASVASGGITTHFAGVEPALTAANVPAIAAVPAAGDAITMRDNTLVVPD